MHRPETSSAISATAGTLEPWSLKTTNGRPSGDTEEGPADTLGSDRAGKASCDATGQEPTVDATGTVEASAGHGGRGVFNRIVSKS